MPNLQVISLEAHAQKKWLRSPDYRFAAADAALPLAVNEVTQAMMAMPLALVRRDEAYTLVALMGFVPGKNLFVARDGRWLARYVPAAYRAYPFALADAEGGQQVLCIDTAGGAVSDIAGEAFFGDDGKPAPAVAEVLNFLSQTETSRRAAQTLCARLQALQLIKPWALTLRGSHGEQQVAGLFCVDEEALNKLPAAEYVELRDSGVLVLAYCQLLSMQHVAILSQLAEAHAKADTAASELPTRGKDLDLSFMLAGDTFKFGGN